MTSDSITAGLGLAQAQAVVQRLFDPAVAVRHQFEEPVNAWHLWQAVRGGISVLVDATDGTFLFAGSAVSPDVHVAEFAKGTRTSFADVADTEGQFLVRCRYGTGRDETWDYGWDGAGDAPVLMCEAHHYPAGGLAYLGSTDDPCRFWDRSLDEYRTLFPAEAQERLGVEGRTP